MRFAGAFLVLCAFAAAPPLRAQDDVVMKAMRDEMARSVKQLQLENLEKPYFISYRVIDSDGGSVSAAFGALSQRSEHRGRMLSVSVRVGDYKLDNTNFFTQSFSMTMSPAMGGNAQLPIEDDYNELRRQIWLATDATYKKAVEDLSKKRAVLQNKTRDDNTPDFTHEDPVTTSDIAPPVHADLDQWAALARKLSALFKQMPDVFTSGVSLSANNAYVRYLNSEGTSYTRRQPSVTFNAHAATQAANGGQLDDFVWVLGRSLAGIPSEQTLTDRILELGQRMKDLRAASTLENYNGPVLVEGDAAPQLFRFWLLPNLLGTRRTLSDLPGASSVGVPDNPFIDKIGARVLPEFLSVTDNPTIGEFSGTRLAGTCKVDEDGVLTRETRLVEKGYLKTLLTSRNPVRGIEHSTGSQHAGHPAPSNVFVTAENGLAADALRARFLELIKQRNKEFGIVVRRMSSATAPTLAYKVFPDGREELIRGVQFSGLNATSFKEILAASKEPHVLTMQFRPRIAAPTFSISDESYAPVTLAVPALLFEDVNVRKARGETPTPPVARHPYFDK